MDAQLFKIFTDREDFWAEKVKHTLALERHFGAVEARLAALEAQFDPNNFNSLLQGLPAAIDSLREQLNVVIANQTTFLQLLQEIKVTTQEEKQLLTSIDTVTTKIGANIQIIGDVTQVIANEVTALTTNPTIPPDVQAQLQALAEKAQKASDASDALVPVLQGIAANGAPVVPAPPPPPVV